MMAELSERDLALLSALIYCDEVIKQKEGTSLSELVEKLNNMSDADLWETGLTGDFNAMGKEDGIVHLRETLKEIEKSNALMGLTITNNKQTDGITAACFVAGENATVVFRGTDGMVRVWARK